MNNNNNTENNNFICSWYLQAKRKGYMFGYNCLRHKLHKIILAATQFDSLKNYSIFQYCNKNSVAVETSFVTASIQVKSGYIIRY